MTETASAGAALKCHFGADGWLRGPISITHALTPNRYDSGFTRKARGMVQHTEAGYEAGTVATFLNPASQVSAFFSVDEMGHAHQYLPVGHGYVAWAEAGGNAYWRSCECEDKTRTGDPMTAPQITAFAQILEACSEYDGFPLEITDDPVNGHGLITHGDGGVPWGNHPDCPGGVRRAQRPAIIALAHAIRHPAPVPPPTYKPWTADGSTSLAELAAREATQESTILRVTVERGGAFAPDVAHWLDAVFSGPILATAPIPVGIVLYVPVPAA